jgi:hypothetical protein
MKNLQTFEGFMDFFKDKFKRVCDLVGDNLKKIPGIERKDYHRLSDWFWRVKIEGVDFDFQVRLEKADSIRSRVVVTKFPIILKSGERVTEVNYYEFHSDSPDEVADKVEIHIDLLRMDCVNFIKNEEFFDEFPEGDIKDLCQDLIDFCDLSFKLKRSNRRVISNGNTKTISKPSWILTVPVKRDDRIGYIKPEFINELKMLRQNLESVGLLMKIDADEPTNDALEYRIKITKK